MTETTHPEVPGPHQHWACDEPESPDTNHALYFSGCGRCLLMRARHEMDGPVVWLAHGQTYELRGEKPMRPPGRLYLEVAGGVPRYERLREVLAREGLLEEDA